MRMFFFAMAIAAAALVYYNKEVKYQLMLWSDGGVGNGYRSSGKSVTQGMASFGSSLGNSFESMGKGLSGN
ncbi:MAG: hypothetical protein ACREEE_17015 [Dongiaceae bacterium]